MVKKEFSTVHRYTSITGIPLTKTFHDTGMNLKNKRKKSILLVYRFRNAEVTLILK